MSDPPSARSAADPVAPAPPVITRRGLVSALGIGWLAFTGAAVGMLGAGVRILFPNVLYEPPRAFKAGFPTDYAVGRVDERHKESHGVWIVRGVGGFFALSTVCTHLGCTPIWMPSEEEFRCPCHGSVFRRDGVNTAGPAPRPLERYRITLVEDGQLLIDKGTTYQQEKGEWEQDGAFLPHG